MIKKTPPHIFKPNTPPTIRDVAKLAGVSLGSVSRVVNGKPSVTPAIRDKVEAAIRQISFQPNTVAQSMRSHSSRTVGCIIRDINVPGLAAFVRGAGDVFMDAGYALFLASSEGLPERERKLIAVMAARKADALLMCQYSETDPILAEALRHIGVPIVLIDRESPSWADAVLVDHRGCIRRATEKLFQLGHRRIALITGMDSSFPARERISGFTAAHAAHGVVLDPALVRAGSFKETYGFEQASMLLSAAMPPTAIIAGGIEMLPGVLRATRVLGRVIPDDVSIVGSLNSDLAELFTPSISVERWDYAEVGRLAARFALERIRNGPSESPQRVTVPNEFVLRDSCAAPR